jgi:hypothetical protein
VSGIAGNEAAQRLLSVHEELERLQYSADLLAVMGTAEGRRFLWGLIGRAGVFEQSFSSDALSTAFNEGKRSVGLALLSRLITETPDLYLKAQNEFIEGQSKAQHLRDAAKAEADQTQEENEIV